MIIENVLISQNKTLDGGGLFYYNEVPIEVLKNVTIKNNLCERKEVEFIRMQIYSFLILQIAVFF